LDQLYNFSEKGVINVAWSEARHVAGSHGVCSAGPKLNAAWDSCVANVCSALPWCCTSYWTQQCVNQVATACTDRNCTGSG
jgi:hypothetical protein